MLRIAMGFGLMAVLFTATGCTMCCHPYDDCGPVYDSCGGQSCSVYHRVGSILSGSPELPTLAQQPVQEESPSSMVDSGPVQEGDVPGSERIVSVTDRVVEPSGRLAGSTRVASESPKASRNPSEIKGWTARRPTFETRR